MKQYIILIILAGIIASGCLKDKVNLPAQNADDYNAVYMPQAISSPNTANLAFTTDDQFLIYGADYGGIGYPQQDIHVSFTVSPDSVAAFNSRNGTNYPLMPNGSYELDATDAVIPKGALSTQPLRITVKTQGILSLFKEYLLPVTIKADGNFKLNNNLSTTYYVVKASLDVSDFPEFDKAAWKIIFFSSEEVNGEGPNNGRAIFAIDNDINTYWHTEYSDVFANPPHILVVDMNETKTVHGVSFTARQNENRGRPMEVMVQTSINGTDWSDPENYTLQSTNDPQKLFFLSGFKDARYIKLTITKMYDNATHTHLAELGAF